jgi:hypothetical protein
VREEECEQGSGLRGGVFVETSCFVAEGCLEEGERDRSWKTVRGMSFRASPTASPNASQTASRTASRRQLCPLASVIAVPTAFPTTVPHLPPSLSDCNGLNEIGEAAGTAVGKATGTAGGKTVGGRGSGRVGERGSGGAGERWSGGAGGFVVATGRRGRSGPCKKND